MNIEKESFETRLKKADEKIESAKTNDGDLEIRDALLEKAELYFEVKDNENYRQYILKALEKSVGNSKKLELNMLILNNYYHERNFEKFLEQLKTCNLYTDDSLDWESKNKLAIYEGIAHILRKDIVSAAQLLLGCINTFNSPEIMSFNELVKYSVILGLVGLSRKDVREKIILNSEIFSVLNENTLLKDLTLTIYENRYHQFFNTLIDVNSEILVKDILLSRHRNHILKRARIVIYSLFLESYKTVKLNKMAASFGVSIEFLDRELSEFISQKYLNCKIDKVNLIVDSVFVDNRSNVYREIERKGDALVERLHKLIKTADN